MKSWQIGVAVCLAIGGCNGSPAVPKIQTLPVKGTITLDDKPLAGANVVFMTFDPPAAFIGTTKEDGTYQLQGPEGRDASLKGSCKVTVSRMVKPDGSLLAPGELPAMVHAVEQLSPRYSRLESTVLAESLTPEGGTFDFKLTTK
jgi:hypothetical protein